MLAEGSSGCNEALVEVEGMAWLEEEEAEEGAASKTPTLAADRIWSPRSRMLPAQRRPSELGGAGECSCSGTSDAPSVTHDGGPGGREGSEPPGGARRRRMTVDK